MLLENGTKKDYAYGKWLGNRYKSFPNIVWFNGNDFQQYRDSTANAAVSGRGARHQSNRQAPHPDGPARQLQIRHTRERLTRQPGLDARHRPRCRLHLLPDLCPGAQGVQQTQPHPVFMVEANYEFEQEYSGAGDAAAPGVLVVAQRRVGPALRQQVHVAVHRRLEGPSRHDRCDRNCGTSRSCSSIGRGSDSSPIRNTSSSPPASGVFGIRQCQ